MRENDSNVMPKIVIGGIAKPNEVEEFYKYLETEGEKKKTGICHTIFVFQEV